MAESRAQAVARRRRERETREAEERARIGHQDRTGSEPDYAQRRRGGWVGGLREGALQADTAMRSAANTLTLGGGNSLAAGLDALVPVPGQGLRARYEDRLAAERARDQYDAVYRRGAQQIGASAATALSIFGGGGLAAPKLMRGAALPSRLETAAALGAGGASGLAFQRLADATAGRPTDWRDGLGAIAGGLVGAATLPLGSGRAAAAGSAATTAAQNALHGQPTSADELGRSAAAGRVIGAGAGAVGRQLSQNLSPRAKGRLGEAMGAVRSDINRMRREPGPKELIQPVKSKPRTRPDGKSGDDFFEDKFGPSAALSAGQRIAQSALGPNYFVYHFLPEHVGKIASLPLTGLAPQAVNRRPANRRGPSR